MYHEHPLKILKYSIKNIWLLIFPLLRGIHAMTLDVNKLYIWIKGAWFDIAVLGAILLFGFISWYFSLITITKDSIKHRQGILVVMNKSIPFNNLSSVTVERSFFLKPFGGMKIYCETCAGIFKSSDMKLLVSKKLATEIMNQLPEIDIKDGLKYHHKTNLISVLLFSVFFSSSFSGAVYIAAFFFKGGDIARELLAVPFERITEETSKISKMLIINIPVAAVGIGTFFLITWFISFVINMFKYSGFNVRSDAHQIEIVCGIITKRTYRINTKSINYTDLRQNLIMKICRMVSVSVSCAGYGSVNKSLPIVMPIKKEKKMKKRLEEIGINSAQKNKYRPRYSSFWQYIWAPVIIAVSIYPLYKVIPIFYPKSSELVLFAVIMTEIPVIWMIFVKIAALFTSGISIYDGKISIRYSKWLSFHTVIAEQEKLVKITITNTPFQRFFKKCTISFNFNDENQQRHYVKAIPIKDAETIVRLLGYEYSINQ